MNQTLHYVKKAGAAAITAAALTVTGIITAFGAVNGNGLDTINETAECSLTIHKYDKPSTTGLSPADGERDTDIEETMKEHAVAGVEFTVIRVGDVQTREITVENTEQVSVCYSLPDALAFTCLGIPGNEAVLLDEENKIKYYTADQIMKALDLKLTGNSVDIKNKLTAYAEAHSDSGVSGETDENGIAEFTGLSTGLYLAAETRVPQNITTTTNPFFVSLPMTNGDGDRYLYNVHVYPKNQSDVPVIDKVVRNGETESFKDYTSASVGDIVDYRVVTKTAPVTDNATRYTTWSVTDTLTKGLDYVNITSKTDTIVQIYDTEEAASQAGTASSRVQLSAEDYEISYTAGARTFTVSLTESGLNILNRAAESETYIAFAYKAKINKDAVLGDAGTAGTGNDNTAALTWGRTSQTYTQTIRDTARVYTYAIDLTKILSDHPEKASELLPTVEFTLYDETRKQQVSADSINSFTYRVNDAHTSGYIFKPSADGKLNIEGLAAGSYTLTEVKSASGYALLKSPISIIIHSSEASASAEIAGHNPSNTQERTEGYDASITTSQSAAAEVDGSQVSMLPSGESANAIVNLEITNTKTWIPNLPQTGGLGTMLLALSGAGLIGFGLLAGRGRKEREAEQEQS